jgi:hypothetical protein
MQDSLATQKAYLTKYDYYTQGCFGFDTSSALGALQGFICNAINDQGNNRGNTADGVISAATWAHVVWRYNGAGGANADRLKCYVNNVEKALTFTGTIPAALTSATATVKVARFGGSLTRYWNGRIAEVVIYDHALALGEIEALYRGYIKKVGLILYAPQWGVASPEPDLSGNCYNGTVTGAILANHAPVGRYAPMPRFKPSAPPYLEYINVSDSIGLADALGALSEWLTVSDSLALIDSAYLIGEVLIDGLRLEHALRIRISEPTNIKSKPVSKGLPKRKYQGKQGRSIEIEGWVPTVAELDTITAFADGAIHYLQLPTGTRIAIHIPKAPTRRPVETPDEYPYTISAVEVAA